MRVFCECCGDELTEAGALLFSPPSNTNVCVKKHFCFDCFNKIIKFIEFEPAKEVGVCRDA